MQIKIYITNRKTHILKILRNKNNKCLYIYIYIQIYIQINAIYIYIYRQTQYIYIYRQIQYIYIYIQIQIQIYIYKDNKDNTSKVLKQRKQQNWNLKCHADTAAIFSQMNKMLKFTIPWYCLHNMTSRYSFHEMFSQEIRLSSNLVNYREREFGQIHGNSNFM